MHFRNAHIAARFAMATACVSASLASSTVSRADPRVCIQAHSAGQRELKAGHLRAAARLFTACGSEPSCPDDVRRECTEFLESAKRLTPSVIFVVQDESGKDVTAVRVYSGDELVVDSLDGRAIELDPGTRHLRFLLPGGRVVATDVLIRESEKGRIIEVKRERAASAATTPPNNAGARLVAPWIATGIGVAALGTGIVLGAMGSNKKSELDACQPQCPASKQPVYDNTKTLYLGADIAFGTAAVATVVATWLFLSATSSGGEKPTQGVSIQPRAGVAPGGGSVGIVGVF
jgi:hypothetical protein